MGYEDRKYTGKSASLKVNFCRKLYNNGNYYVASFYILQFQHGELSLPYGEENLVCNGKISCDLDKDYEYILTIMHGIIILLTTILMIIAFIYNWFFDYSIFYLAVFCAMAGIVKVYLLTKKVEDK